jgi:hypothetical protein
VGFTRTLFVAIQIWFDLKFCTPASVFLTLGGGRTVVPIATPPFVAWTRVSSMIKMLAMKNRDDLSMVYDVIEFVGQMAFINVLAETDEVSKVRRSTEIGRN